MQTCSIQDSSLKFSRAVYGSLTFIAYFIRNEWFLLAAGLLILLGMISIKLNIPYQLHSFFLKKGSKPTQIEKAELSFVWGMMATFILGGFWFIHIGKFVEAAWIFILMVAILLFVSCLIGFCLATSIYIITKKIFRK